MSSTRRRPLYRVCATRRWRGVAASTASTRLGEEFKPSTRRRHRSFSAQDWEDALEGQEPFAGGAAPAEAPFADDGPDTQSFEKTSEKGDGDDGDDFD